MAKERKDGKKGREDRSESHKTDNQIEQTCEGPGYCVDITL